MRIRWNPTYFKRLARSVDSTSDTGWTIADRTSEQWLDVSDYSSLSFASGLLVNQINDKSGNNRYMLNNTLYPEYDATTFGLVFSPARLRTAVSSTWLYGEYSIFCLHKTATAAPNPVWGYCGIDEVQSMSIGYQYTGALRFSHGNFNDADFSLANTVDPVQHCVRYTSPGSVVHSNGNLLGTNLTHPTFDFSTAGRFDLGSGYGSRNFYGTIYEMVVLAGELTTHEQQQIEGYLAWKWDALWDNTNLVDALPLDHEYKSERPT